MKPIVVTLLAAVLLIACRPRVEVPPPDTTTAPQASIAKPLPINIGDVEAQLHVYCDVAADLAEQEHIVITRMNTRKYDPGMITVDCYPPYPTSLRVTCNMDNKMTVKAGVIAMRGNINVDQSPVQSFALFVDKTTDRAMKLGEADVLVGVANHPDTLLVNATATVVLLPENTDTSTIDLEIVQGTPETQSVLLSNPIRINFLPAKETP